MRQKLALTFFLMAIAAALQAQPNIYMIPDIGTPGMNTYVEIVGPANETGKFLLPDGLASPSLLKIRFMNPLDSNRVKVSPGVVSWNQRLITFQFFVTPGAALGPVPIELDISGQLFPLDTFFIVAPQRFGTKSGGGVIGGAPVYGTGLGKRSKRGAMIVDDMVLNGGNYTIDVSDTDPAVAGNQGYLPFILISKGGVVIRSGATISASAPRGINSKNGGPGGGGGGGYGTDRPPAFPIPVNIPGENDTPLGNGFTGGKSTVPVVPSPGGFGEGSGSSAASLNGLAAINTFKTTDLTARLYAAGPGHPFDVDGRSGGAAVSMANAPPNIIGTYYGGGGNASKGSGLPLAQDDYNGQVVGNVELVPLHGGAGGASGGFNDSVGGGGGGAIALYASTDAIVSYAEARGGDGKNGCDNCGFGSGDASAGGAGGGVVIGARGRLSIAQVDVEGGSPGITAASAVPGSTSGHGGGGRFRGDGRLEGGLSLIPDLSQYSGPTLDTLTYISSRNHTLRGTGRYQPRDGGDSIIVFIRGANSRWNFNTPYRTHVRSDSTWSVDVTFPNDTLFYVCVLQETPALERGMATPFTFVPSHIFSQSAAAIVRMQTAVPSIDAPTARALDTMRCPASICDTFMVRNTGSSDLIINAATAFTGPNRALYRLLEPTLPITIAPGASRRWIVCFDGMAAGNGGRGATLRLESNDPTRPRWDIAYTIERRAPAPLTIAPSSIAFGDVQIGNSVQQRAIVTNPRGPESVAQTISGVRLSPTNPQVRILWPTIPPSRTLAPGDTMHVVLEYTPLSTARIPAMTLCVLTSAPCVDSLCVPVTGRGITASLIASRGRLSIIDSACSTPTAAEDTLRLINTGSAPITLNGITTTPFDLFTIVPPMPTGPIPPGGSIVVRIRFNPTRAVDTLGTLTINSNDPLRSSFTVELHGRRDTVIVEPALRLVQFRPKLSCETRTDTVVVIYNRGNDTARLFPVNITPPFLLTAAPPYFIPPRDSIAIRVAFVPGTGGTFSSEIQYLVTPCNTYDTIRLRGEQVDPDYAAGDVAFGDVTVGGSGTATSTVTNNTAVGIRISGARVVPPSADFTVDPTQFPLRIAAGGSGQIRFTYTPASAGDIPGGVRIEVDIDSVCTLRLGAAVTGRGVPGGVALSKSSVAFGKLLTCESAEDTITISNVSAIPVTLGAPAITPAGAAANFAIVGGSFVAGPLAPGASATIIVRFTPGNGPDAPRSGAIEITSSDPLRPRIDIPLSGELVSAGLAFAGPGFTPIGAGSNTNVTRWIVNSGSAPMTIDGLGIQAPFRVISTIPTLPATLAPGDSLAVELEFAPAQPGDFTDSLRLVFRSACDSVAFEVEGMAIDLSVIIASASWEDMAGAPGDVIMIPLRLRDDITPLGVTSYTAGAKFNPSLLYPLRIILDGTIANGWSVVDQSLAPGNVRFTAQGTSLLSGTGIIAFLEARVMLGDSTATLVGPGDTAGTNSARARLSVISGLFTLQGYCDVGGPRLVQVTGAAGLKAVRPNPVTGSSEVEIETIEEGHTRLVLFDALGRETQVLLDAELAPQSYIVTLQRGALPAGVYYLELRTPTTRERMKVVVER